MRRLSPSGNFWKAIKNSPKRKDCFTSGGVGAGGRHKSLNIKQFIELWNYGIISLLIVGIYTYVVEG